MKEKEFKDKLFLITYGIILFVLLINYKWLFSLFNVVTKILSPFIIGIICAMILNVLVNFLEQGLLKKVKKNKRLLSVLMSLIIVFGFIVFLILILIPQIKNAGEIFVDNIPEYQKTIHDIGKNLGFSNEELKFLDLENTNIKKEISDYLTTNSDRILNFSMGFASSVVSVVCNFFVGLVFAIYLLMGKEKLLNQFKKLLQCIMNDKIYKKFCEVMSLSNSIFSSFIKVQFVEAFILGTLCFLGMLLFRLPYAATISVLVGVTALIPVFGAFIGCVVGTFLIFMIKPIKAITFIIFFLILQQIEGNFIYPRVVGGKIGLPGIWVLVAVTIGGSVGGILGMLLGVPILSVVYSLVKVSVNKKVERKNKKKEA